MTGVNEQGGSSSDEEDNRPFIHDSDIIGNSNSSSQSNHNLKYLLMANSSKHSYKRAFISSNN